MAYTLEISKTFNDGLNLHLVKEFTKEDIHTVLEDVNSVVREFESEASKKAETVSLQKKLLKELDEWKEKYEDKAGWDPQSEDAFKRITALLSENINL